MSTKKVKIPQNYVIRADGRVEWICEHGCGHPLFVLGIKNPESHWFIHGCDGCEPTLQDLKQLTQSIRYVLKCEKCGKSPIKWHLPSLTNKRSVSSILGELNRHQRLCKKCYIKNNQGDNNE